MATTYPVYNYEDHDNKHPYHLPLCHEKPVRELEAYRDKLEKKLEITVARLEIIKIMTKVSGSPFQEILHRDVVECLKEVKELSKTTGDKNEM